MWRMNKVFMFLQTLKIIVCSKWCCLRFGNKSCKCANFSGKDKNEEQFYYLDEDLESSIHY